MPDGGNTLQAAARLAEIRTAVEQAVEPPPPAGEPGAPTAYQGGEPPPWGGDDMPPPVDNADQARDLADLARASDPDADRPTHKPPGWEGQSPVVPLGTHQGVYFYLDPLGQVRALKAGEHGQAHLVGLFAPYLNVLDNWWPRFKAVTRKGEDPDFEWAGCKYEAARDDLMAACSRRGIWTPFGRMRGVGAWRGEDGELILHCGDAVWRGPSDGRLAAWLPPREIDGQVYAAGEAQPRPSEAGDADATDAAEELLALLRTWAWKRPMDPVLLLGWIGAAMIGGALRWRPMVWLTGDAGTGKSTLQELVKGLLGSGLVQSSDATGAGIWQVVGMSSLPVAIDELEPQDTKARTDAVIGLARQAASGNVILRGGQDHQGAQFRAQSTFLFSSILIPPITDADRSRMAILDLDPLPRSVTPPDVTPKRMAALGARLRARLLTMWPRVHETLEQFRGGLADVGHAARGADQFGTLLAIARLLLSDEAMTPELLARWCAPFEASQLVETSEKLADWQDWLLQLGSTRVNAYRGGNQRTLGRIIEDASQEHDDSGGQMAADSNNELLSGFGLRVYGPRSLDGLDGQYLAVANRHAGLAEVFAATKWAGGVWSQSAGRVPGARKWPKALRFSGQSARATLIPLSIVLDPMGGSPSDDEKGPSPSPAPGGGPQAPGDGRPPSGGAAFPDPTLDPDPSQCEAIP